ncbi:unnamed protein product [Callosobruchus maculatus]|uniref:Uncharacterized protein n=1 Tax=Callosobruchus maculatus TaxID=64391 RepID=A0A653D2Y9_CALMS|nr:unnamed protein product [Callosobruchus maculatus]
MSLERDPNKRRVKPVEQACVLDFDEESSDDSDFRIEDHPEASDDDDDDSGTGQEDASEEQSETSDDEDEDDEEDDLIAFRDSISNHKVTSVADIINQAAMHQKFNLDEQSAAQVLICAGCLGDQSDGVNEIVECDGCGVTVHEACYGISDTASLDSTDSLSPTTPWFCEACKAGVKNPVCELCPNSGGVFKETDVGRWVHLVCALYVPGVAFGEVSQPRYP